MGTINYKNLTIKYDNTTITIKKLKQIKIFRTIGVIIVSILTLITSVLGVFLLNFENHLVISALLEAIIMLATMLGGTVIIVSIEKKLAPKHFEFIDWITRFKKDEIDVTWDGNKYIINMCIKANEWTRRELGNFVDEAYTLEDKSSKELPIHMTVDLTGEKVRILVDNN